MKTKKTKPVYKITAQVIKLGGSPTTWTRYSDSEMTQKQCEKWLSVKGEGGRSVSVNVTLENFKCEAVS